MIYRNILLADLDECDFFPCQHNGTCLNNNGSYSCNCTSGWRGQDCEEGYPHYYLKSCRGHSWRVRLAKQETLTPPGHLVSPLVCRGP